ncbi:hypothetical protein CDL15_Pgr027154 [Punica granatum]|uniref:Uncharacterized protein n=1 Tax=Punica granatum TaxID=22663 RepID=A0A218XB74_PUNGR|nr:hypothetical protein CDL15_Pgr027154 [Punica granatum]
MSRPVSCPHLDRVTPPLEEITRIWGALRPVDRRYISTFIAIADRQSNVKQVLDAWRTVITERPYFPEHPTLDERDFQATEEYIIRFYRWGPAAHEDLVNSPRVEDGRSPGATPTPNMAIQTELTHLRAERISGPKEIIFVEKSQRRTSSLLINANYRESSPRPVLSYRGVIRNWHE